MPINLPLRILLEATISCMLMQQFGFLAARIPSNATRHTVNLSNGSSIQGFVSSIRNKTVWNYLGIPYAKPPVGPLRFKPSEPLEKPLGNSSKPFDASSKPNSCYYWPLKPQEFEKKNKALMMWWNNTEMSEDCLYLNVWSPTSDKADKKDNPGKPVMVWIYGGGFFGGSSTLEVYDGAVLAATGGVVVASMQYRTGVLGFLFLDDREAPGNAGLYDQYRAIQWIHQNVHSFGGDRSRITLFGESAGAVSVSYHMLSPYTQGYFQRAILNSGSAIAWWASENRWFASRKTMKLAELVKCRSGNDNDATKIMTCMRQVRPELLQEKTYMSMSSESGERDQQYAQYIKEKPPRNQDAARVMKNETQLFLVVPFKPVFSTDFLPNMPETQLEQSPMKNNVKKADLLVGVVKDEGVFWIMYALSNIFLHKNGEWNIPFWWGQTLSPKLNAEYEFLVKNRPKFDMDNDPYNLVARYFLTNNTNLDSLISEAVSFEYQIPSKLFGRTSWTRKDTLDALDDMTGDKSFKCPTILFADMYSQMLGAYGANSIWMYSFEHRSELLPLPEWTGVLHGYELDYVFGTPFNQRFTRDYYNFTETEAQLSDDVMKFWTNFAKTGNPNQGSKSSSSSLNSTQVWPAYDLSSRRYIVLSARPSSGPAFRTGQNFRKRQCEFLRYQVPNIRKQIDARFNCSSKSVPPNEEPNGPTSGSGYLRSAIIISLLTVGFFITLLLVFKHI